MKARHLLALTLITLSLYPSMANASMQMGRSDREELDRLKAWRDNQDIPKEGVLAGNAVKQINRAEEVCGNIASDQDLKSCGELIRGAAAMRERMGKSEAEIRAETQGQLERTLAKREKSGAQAVLKPNETGMTKKEAIAESSPREEAQRKAKGKLFMQDLQQERQFEQESAARTNAQLNPQKPAVTAKIKSLFTRKK